MPRIQPCDFRCAGVAWSLPRFFFRCWFSSLLLSQVVFPYSSVEYAKSNVRRLQIDQPINTRPSLFSLTLFEFRGGAVNLKTLSDDEEKGSCGCRCEVNGFLVLGLPIPFEDPVLL